MHSTPNPSARAMSNTQAEAAAPATASLPDGGTITAFICANTARAGFAPSSGRRPRPTKPDFQWPCTTHEVLVPCAGRLQPEHLLKAIEGGADLVCIVACAEDNCHSTEGSRRAKCRADFVDRLLQESGLGPGRVLLLHLSGSAHEDMALGAASESQTVPAAPTQEELAAHLQVLREEVIQRLKTLAPNPLRSAAPCEAADGPYQVEDTDDSED